MNNENNENNENNVPMPDLPTINDYQYQLSPFKLQVLQNFPYIEADFDAITNYQLLCKVVDYLNQVIANENTVESNVTNLATSYTALYNYINNYFTNLDVQDEVNHKLDEMTANGTLTSLISNYVDPIYEAYETEINGEITNINNKVNAVASGSPLVASSVAGMTDTTKTYVNTTDGKWYYYDGDSWEIGGVYQATQVDDNSITGNKLYNYEVTDPLYTGKNVNASGNVVDSANWTCSDFIPVSAGDTIVIKSAFGLYAALFNESKTIVTHYDEYTATSDKTFTVPNNISYIRINILNTNLADYELSINGEKFIFNKYQYDWLTINSKNIEDIDELISSLPIDNIWSGKNMIMFGDSIVEAYYDTPRYAGYNERLKNYLNLNLSTNEGISGRPMANGTPNGDGTNTTIKNTNLSNYDLVLIAAGTNDFKLNVPLGTLGQIGDTTFNTNTFYGAYRDAIEYIITNKPSAKICLWTPIQRDNAGYDVNYTNSAGCKLIDYVNAIKSLGEMYSIPICDMYSNSGITKLNLSTYTVDGLHPNKDGYDYMSIYYNSFIKNL